jgi:serine protease Do
MNLRGESFGINTAIISRSGGSQGSVRDPSNSCAHCARELAEARPHHPRLSRNSGRRTVPAGARLTANTNGVVVQDVFAWSPRPSTLQPGDVIRKFNCRDVKTLPSCAVLISQVELGKRVELEIIRNGKPLQVAT